MSLAYIGQQINIYGGSIFLFLGIVGNTMNIFIFSSVRTYRRTPCSFYFLIGAIHNIIYIIINLTGRIVSATAFDLPSNSTVWCKLQSFTIAYFGLTSFTCSCLATIDQFFATSRDVNVRLFSKIQLAHRLVIITIIIWFLHAIPTLVFFYASSAAGRCLTTSLIYGTYASFYVLILQCCVPVSIMVVFGSLTYRNMHLTRFLAEQRADRQLVRMTLIQVFLVVISMTPYGCYGIYSLVTLKVSKDIDRIEKEVFVSIVFAVISYFYFTGNFYMFLISSSRFRQTVKDASSWHHRQNRIAPILQPAF